MRYNWYWCIYNIIRNNKANTSGLLEQIKNNIHLGIWLDVNAQPNKKTENKKLNNKKSDININVL